MYSDAPFCNWNTLGEELSSSNSKSFSLVILFFAFDLVLNDQSVMVGLWIGLQSDGLRIVQLLGLVWLDEGVGLVYGMFTVRNGLNIFTSWHICSHIWHINWAFVRIGKKSAQLVVSIY